MLNSDNLHGGIWKQDHGPLLMINVFIKGFLESCHRPAFHPVTSQQEGSTLSEEISP